MEMTNTPETSQASAKRKRMQKVKNQVLAMVPGGGQLLAPPPTLTPLAVKRHVEMSSLTVEECELLSDAKYRTYISQVEKALKSFEYTSEWADLISALGKLNKVLLNHIKYPVVPKKVTIGKRLAQCLHPALPSGVHLKALETYDIIFKCIGTPRLAHDLFVYSAGLFPLMGHAAMNVKPALLGIYEKHFTQLGKQVKPGLNGLLLGLLPGLEEGSEYYDRTNSLLEKFCEAAGPQFFYTCLWECIMTCPSVRLPACTYLSTHYNKRKSMEDQLYLMGHNIDLMVGATCSAVQDSSVLVQRCILDFLLNAFPMHNAQLTRPDTGKIVNAALCVLLRRDMSLNRRLYAWLLGTDSAGTPVFSVSDQGKKGKTETSSVSGELDTTFFQTYAKDKLVSALNSYLSLSADNSAPSLSSEKHVALRPFRILISLLDKPEIGPAIIEDVLLAVFRCLYRECVTKAASAAESSMSGRRPSTLERSSSVSSATGKYQRQDSQVSVELTKTANLLFSTLEPYFIWDFIAKTFEAVCALGSLQEGHPDSSDKGANQSREMPSLLELCQLVDFLLDIVSLETYMETTTEHLPDLLRHITSSLTTHCGVISDQEVTASLKLCAKILQKVQPSMNILGSEAQEKDSDVFLAGDQDIDISNTFSSISQDSKDTEHTDKDVSPTETEGPELDSPAVPDRPGDSSLEEAAESTGSPGGSRKGSTTTLTSRQSENNDPSVDRKILQEFQKYNSIEIERSPSRVSYRISGPLTLMQACVQSFQDFFHVFVSERVLGDKDLPKKCLDLITLSSDSGKGSDRDSVLEGGSIYSQEELTPVSRLGGQLLVSCNKVSAHLCEAFSSACKLLVDFSSFPMYCTDYHKLMDQTLKQDEELTLPCWLQDLITCTSFVESFKIKTAAIATMLDLIILTQSVQSETESKDAEHDQSRSISEGTVSVVILPLLLPKHLRFLNSSTLFYRMVSEGLWDYLGGESTLYHQTSVELFHQLHQVNPNSWVCEDVIGNALIQDDQEKRIDAYKKFTVLWHLTRDKRMEMTPGRQIRTYDRSMFVVLDSLKEDTSPTQTIASTWVTHSLQRGDLGRILEPVLLMLFHPDTARISIQHVNIHQPKKVKLNETGDDIESAEAKIYAISNEGGNVIYHVSSQGKTISKKSAEDLKSYALTVVNEKGSKSKFVTAPTRAQPDFPFERVNSDMLNLRVNPFGTENVLDRLVFDGIEIPGVQIPAISPGADPPDLGHIKRLDKETCQKEGIVFEDRDHEEVEVTPSDTPEEAQENVGDIVLQILEELIEDVADSKSSEEPPESVNTEIAIETDPLVPLRSTREASVVSRDSNSLPDDDLLNAIERQGLNIDSPSGSEVDLTKQTWGTSGESNATDIHTLHMHILLYTQKYDFQRTLYALTTLKSLIRACPRLVVVSMATCSISAVRTPHLNKVQSLLARHKKSVFGKNFFGEVPSETLSSCRSSMYLEIVVSVLLYFVRSYYPNLMLSKLAPEELMGNREVHILSGEILMLMMSELILITKDSGKSFASYMDSLLAKCKLQKALLHCVLASIYNARRKSSQEKGALSFTETIVDFNEESLDSSAVETFQIKLLQLLRVMVQLEDHILKAKGDQQDSSTPSAAPEWDRAKLNFQPSLSHMRYNPMLPMVQQGMFLSGILSALKQQHVAHMHRHWIAMVTSSLPFMGKALSHIVMSVVSQLCRNLEMLAQAYGPSKKTSGSGLQRVPPDHMLTMLEGLTTLCHYCLLDSSPQVSLGAPLPSGATTTSEANTYASQIIFNLLHVFNPVSGKDSSPPRDVSTAVSPVMEARRGLLSILPRIIACLSTIWRAIALSNQEAMDTQLEQPNWTMGSPKIIQRYILDFLSPLSQSHGVSLLGAVAVAWNDRRKKSSSHTKKVIPVPCDDQLLLVDLVSEIKVLPTDKLVQMVKQVMKQPPPSELTKNKKSIPLEVNLLQFFFAYIQQTGAAQLIDSWPSLLALIKEGLTLNISPPGQFLLLEILNEAVQRMPVMEDRKSQKELQDIVQKVLDSVSTIAGSCLAQTTWLRRNLAVKPGPQTDIHDVEDGDANEESDVEMSPPPERKVIAPQVSNSEISKYSVQALTQLAERTASLLDVVYGSEEKEKVVPFLTSIMYNVFPYLRNHSSHNLPSFRACSQFLASISGYQYSRKSWRKEALELLLDASFFQMDHKCIGYWETIIDNLMTHDKTTFKDLMSRVTVVQTGSLNLFSSKDQEFEQRTLLLKRLAFTLFCSEPDQYQRNMPEIQERLSEGLRLPQVPSVMAQVFLCFRVLILRMSPQHLTSLWPTIITEMVQVFLQIEQELSTETDEFKAQLQRIAALDSTWAHLGNGLNAHNNPAWLQLYLSACKLLDLALALPADVIPQFQLYRWAFIGEDCTDEDGSKRENAWTKPTFVPHIVRISRLLNNKVPRECGVLQRSLGKPLLLMTYLRSLVELQPFFNTLASPEGQDSSSQKKRLLLEACGSMSKSRSAPEFSGLSRSTSLSHPVHLRSAHQHIEASVEKDFLEFLPPA